MMLSEMELQTLDELASAFGIPRSTAWTIRNGGHKASGLSMSIIDRMLSAPKLPPSVLTTLLEYIDANGKVARASCAGGSGL